MASVTCRGHSYARLKPPDAHTAIHTYNGRWWSDLWNNFWNSQVTRLAAKRK
jgi:hypothetical protein